MKKIANKAGMQRQRLYWHMEISLSLKIIIDYFIVN
jgi:DNA-binding phage protein